MPEYKKVFEIRVVRVDAIDDEPAGFVATNDELGLVVEADSLDELALQIEAVAFDLFELNVLPKLREEMNREVKPAFAIKHLLSDRGLGKLLPGIDGTVAA
ncbi:MAG: DUF1902 domain-containing protein [Pseudomonadota bacterium]